MQSCITPLPSGISFLHLGAPRSLKGAENPAVRGCHAAAEGIPGYVSPIDPTVTCYSGLRLDTEKFPDREERVIFEPQSSKRER